MINAGLLREVQELREALRKDRAELNVYTTLLVDLKQMKKDLEKRRRLTEEARIVFQQVAVQTQRGIQNHLDGLVSAALAAVFDDPYQFKAIFEMKRNKAECRMVFDAGDHEMDPLESSGGGPIDVAAFALKTAYQQLAGNRKVLIFDECMKYVSRDRIPYAADMVKEINKRLGIQIIMVTHVPEFEKISSNTIYIKSGEVSSQGDE